MNIKNLCRIEDSERIEDGKVGNLVMGFLTTLLSLASCSEKVEEDPYFDTEKVENVAKLVTSVNDWSNAVQKRQKINEQGGMKNTIRDIFDTSSFEDTEENREARTWFREQILSVIPWLKSSNYSEGLYCPELVSEYNALDDGVKDALKKLVVKDEAFRQSNLHPNNYTCYEILSWFGVR